MHLTYSDIFKNGKKSYHGTHLTFFQQPRAISMSTARSKYQLHAEVRRTGQALAQFDDAKSGYPLARRMNRMERVAASYHGHIDQIFNNGLLITFATADAALLGACEMQQRCAGLPQTAGQKLALRIGIHQGPIRQRLEDDSNGSDGSREIASQLAISDDDIVVSETVIADLNPELRKMTQPVDQASPVDLVAHSVNWRCEIPSTAYGGEALWSVSQASAASGPSLILHQGLKTLELSESNPVATVGRSPSNDLVVTDIFVSRKHCRIERQADCIVLTDWSTNGTCVVPDEGAELLVKNDSLYLKGKGLLFFGRLCNGERRGAVRFETS
jgi:hypothetical protein